MSTATEGRRVEINLGHRCNNKCVFCMSDVYRDAKSPWADLDKVKSELREFYGRGCRSLGFLGGEPTVYPRLLECMAYAKELGYTRIALCTNGTRLSNPDFCRRLVEAGLTRVALSVHSHRAELEDGPITGVPGNLGRKIKALGNLFALRRRGFLPDNISLNPVLCGPTLPDMEGYIRFFSRLGVRDIRFNYIWPQGGVVGDKEWTPSFRQAIPAIARILLLNERRLKLRLTFGGIPKCVLRFAGLSPALTAHFAAKYFDEGVFDPANDVSLAGGGGKERFVWQEQKRDALKTMGPDCGTCRHAGGCEGVWRTYAELHGFSELEPVR